jgi:hypothetical protein
VSAAKIEHQAGESKEQMHDNVPNHGRKST